MLTLLCKSSEYYIDEYKRREGALQFIESHREHFIHPFHVFVLGFLILSKCCEKGQERLRRFFKFADTAHLVKAWFMACIYHDVGYPAEKLPLLVTDMFREAVGREVVCNVDWSSLVVAENMDTHVQKMAERFVRMFGRTRYATTQGFRRWFYHMLLEQHDHGALSSLVLLKQCEKVIGQGLEAEVAYRAALAIALHNVKLRKNDRPKINLAEFFDKDFPIEIDRLPLAFFLQYCDNVQEWGRRVYYERIKLDKNPGIGKSSEDTFETRLTAIDCEDEVVVAIKYIRAAKNDEIADNFSLQQLFQELDYHFDGFWKLGSKSPNNFRGEARDRDNAMVGSFSPRKP